MEPFRCFSFQTRLRQPTPHPPLLKSHQFGPSCAGSYGIEARLYHFEDINYDDSEGVPHYVMLNAGTGLMCCYPEVLIVTDEDRANLGAFFTKLVAAPFFMKFNVGGRANDSARRLNFICSNTRCRELPLAPALQHKLFPGGVPLE